MYTLVIILDEISSDRRMMRYLLHHQICLPSVIDIGPIAIEQPIWWAEIQSLIASEWVKNKLTLQESGLKA